MTAKSVFPSVVARNDAPPHAHQEPAVRQEWFLVVHLVPGCGTTALLKVMSTLHLRHAEVSSMQYMTTPDGGGILTIECSTLVASIETVRKSIEKAVQVVSATVRETH